MTEATKFAIDRPALSCGGSMTITNADFKAALAKVSPSLSAKVLLVCLYVFPPFIYMFLHLTSLMFLGPGMQEMGATREKDWCCSGLICDGLVDLCLTYLCVHDVSFLFVFCSMLVTSLKCWRPLISMEILVILLVVLNLYKYSLVLFCYSHNLQFCYSPAVTNGQVNSLIFVFSNIKGL